MNYCTWGMEYVKCWLNCIGSLDITVECLPHISANRMNYWTVNIRCWCGACLTDKLFSRYNKEMKIFVTIIRMFINLYILFSWDSTTVVPSSSRLCPIIACNFIPIHTSVFLVLLLAFLISWKFGKRKSVLFGCKYLYF